MKIWQLYHKEEQQKFIFGIPRKNKDTQSIYRENTDILDIYYNEDWQNENLIGVLSWRFTEKTGIGLKEITEAIQPDIHCYNMSPFPFNEYRHTYDPIGTQNVKDMCDYIDTKKIFSFKLKYFDMRGHLAFCNFWLLSPDLFNDYVKNFLQPVMNWFENDRSPKMQELKNRIFHHYTGDIKEASLFFEGLFGVWLISNNITFKYIQNGLHKDWKQGL